MCLCVTEQAAGPLNAGWLFSSTACGLNWARTRVTLLTGCKSLYVPPAEYFNTDKCGGGSSRCVAAMSTQHNRAAWAAKGETAHGACTEYCTVGWICPQYPPASCHVMHSVLECSSKQTCICFFPAAAEAENPVRQRTRGAQGGKQRVYEIAPLYDRNQIDIPRSQLDFIKRLHLRDAFSALAVIAPAFKQMAIAGLDETVVCYTMLHKAGGGGCQVVVRCPGTRPGCTCRRSIWAAVTVIECHAFWCLVECQQECGAALRCTAVVEG
jgi:hypothetical protein